MNFLALPKYRVFTTSFLILFLELVLIRWIPAYIISAGFFSNLILLATFLGMGVGLLLTNSSKKFFYYFPITLLFLIAFVILFKLELHISSTRMIFFKGLPTNAVILDSFILLPIIFIAVTMIFISISQELGRLFSKLKPLEAYSWDISGSLSGLLVFSILSFFSIPAYVWFILVVVIYFLLMPKKITKVTLLVYFLLLIIPLSVFSANKKAIWSPYYKITLGSSNGMFVINTNNISHQYISDYKVREPFYNKQYEVFKKYDYRTILIIGAGNGADIATALAKNPGVELIDAVEIDPKIAEIGKKLNPNKPFSDPRVHLYINDGRNFLENSNKKYDLIIYALTDSLIMTNGTANIRLESFLFTKESFALAKKHLTDNGLLVLYNYYRHDWLIEKINLTLQSVFGKPTYVYSYGDFGKAATFLAGPKTRELTHSSVNPKESTLSNQPIAEDDWPFIYLREKGIPLFYVKLLSIIGVISLIFIFLATSRKRIQFNWFMFSLGAAFLLLETKNLVTFGLLFGTTWTVNALVIGAILALVLAANILSSKLTIKNIYIVYIILVGILICNYLVTPAFFLKFPVLIRYITSSVFYLSPLFFASIIFSQAFKHDKNAASSFGSNVLGIILGGLLEYSSLALGYKNLILIVIAFYLLSFVLLKWKKGLPFS